MNYEISVSELGWEQERTLDEHIPVHRVLYELLDAAKTEGINRASDVYADLASYGLYFLPAPNSELDEIPKDHAIRTNHLQLSKKLFVLHRGKKATQNRRRDEETYRIQFETRNDTEANETDISNRLDKATVSNLQSRPKRKRTTLITPSNPPKRRRNTKQAPKQKNDLSGVTRALSQAEDISKTKKKLQQTKTKRMKQIHTRQQKLPALHPSELSYGN